MNQTMKCRKLVKGNSMNQEWTQPESKKIRINNKNWNKFPTNKFKGHLRRNIIDRIHKKTSHIL